MPSVVNNWSITRNAVFIFSNLSSNVSVNTNKGWSNYNCSLTTTNVRTLLQNTLTLSKIIALLREKDNYSMRF